MIKMNIADFKQLPILGILRGLTYDAVAPLVEAVISSGLKTIEVTMNTPNDPSIIKAATKESNGKLTIGAGTVLTMDELKAAIDSGASFAVMPTLDNEIVDYCTKRNIPVFPGALTPQEIKNAWDRGATMVKVFPAKFFGPSYFKEIKGPFDKIELLACGGVTPETLTSFLDAGASAVAFGGSIFKRDYLKAKNFSPIVQEIKKLIEVYQRRKNENA